MTDKKPYSGENPLEHYTEFWSEALQKIESLQKLLYAQCNDLEKKYSEFEKIYNTLGDLTTEMVSLYSGFNTLEGHEDLMRLKTIIDRYETNYTRKGIDFDLIYFLLDKVSKDRERSFNNFPAVQHLDFEKEESELPEIKVRIIDETSYFNRPYKWITFERNNSNFMVPFQSIEEINLNDMPISKADQGGEYYVNLDGVEISFKDLLTPLETFYDPKLFLKINESRYLPVDKILKKIFSHTDIITSKIEHFESSHDAPFAGRVKIFGRNHLYLQL